MSAAQDEGQAGTKAQASEQSGLRVLTSFLWHLIEPHRKALWWVALATPVGVLMDTAMPLLIQRAIDGPISAREPEGVWWYASLFAAVVLLRYLSQSLGVYSLQLMALRSLADLGRRLFCHVMSQGQAFFDQRTTGALMTRTTSDVQAISDSLSQGVVRLISDALLIIGTLCVMLWMNWRLTLVAFSISPLLVWVVNLCRAQLKRLHGGIRELLSEQNGLFAEYIKGAKELKRYGAEPHAQARFDERSYAFMKLYHQANWWDAGLYAIMDGLSSLSVGLVITYVAYQAGYGEQVSVGIIVAFIDALNRVYVPIREFSGRLATIQRSVVAIERVMKLLETHQEPQSGALSPEELEGSIELKGLSFSYQEGGAQVLKDVSFEVQAGEVVALVGATGSGKSTIAKLILRMYDGYEGELLIGGYPLRELSLERSRQAVVAVHQDPYLFKASVAENIHLWDPELSERPELVRRAAERARADHFIQGLSEGYESACATGGSNLSVGQRQLITIARAFARPTPFVLLDEATASVDALTERWIDEATSELFAERTVIVIAHRLSTIVKADKIVMLEQGEVVASGTHEELMRSSEPYQALIKQSHEGEG